MSPRDQNLFLEEILEAIELIQDYLGEIPKESFQSDQKTIDAVTRRLEIIGEAASQIDSEIRDKYPLIPWRQIIGMRNIVIHRYFDTDPDIVWVVAHEQLDEIAKVIREILRL
jgi:uncharacterized protein with HEPN domain